MAKYVRSGRKFLGEPPADVTRVERPQADYSGYFDTETAHIARTAHGWWFVETTSELEDEDGYSFGFGWPWSLVTTGGEPVYEVVPADDHNDNTAPHIAVTCRETFVVTIAGTVHELSRDEALKLYSDLDYAILGD